MCRKYNNKILNDQDSKLWATKEGQYPSLGWAMPFIPLPGFVADVHFDIFKKKGVCKISKTFRSPLRGNRPFGLRIRQLKLDLHSHIAKGYGTLSALEQRYNNISIKTI